MPDDWLPKQCFLGNWCLAIGRQALQNWGTKMAWNSIWRMQALMLTPRKTKPMKSLTAIEERHLQRYNIAHGKRHSQLVISDFICSRYYWACCSKAGLAPHSWICKTKSSFLLFSWHWCTQTSHYWKQWTVDIYIYIYIHTYIHTYIMQCEMKHWTDWPQSHLTYTMLDVEFFHIQKYINVKVEVHFTYTLTRYLWQGVLHRKLPCKSNMNLYL